MDEYKSDAFGTDAKENIKSGTALEGQKAVQKHTDTPSSSVAVVGGVKVLGLVLRGPGKETADAHQLQEDSVRAWLHRG